MKLKDLRKSVSSPEAVEAETSIEKLLEETPKNYRNYVDEFFHKHQPIQKICDMIEQMRRRKVECLTIGQKCTPVQNQYTVILRASFPLRTEHYKEFETCYYRFIELLDERHEARFIFEVQQHREPFKPSIVEYHQLVQTPRQQGKPGCLYKFSTSFLPETQLKIIYRQLISMRLYPCLNLEYPKVCEIFCLELVISHRFT